MGWTLDEYMNCASSMPKGTSPFYLSSKSDMLRQLLIYSMDSYVNWDTGELRFESEDFIKLLEYCSAFPSEQEYSEKNWYEMIADGELNFYCYTACGFEDLQIVSKLFGEEIVFKGYPSSTGSWSILVPETTYAISSTCMDKQAAWEFLRTFLTEEYQWDSKLTADGYMQAFPTNKKALEKLAAYSASDSFILPSNGKTFERERYDVVYYPLTIPTRAATSSEVEQILALIDSAKGVRAYNEPIMKIVEDEAADYFEGAISASEAARLIQSRAALYTNEQK